MAFVLLVSAPLHLHAESPRERERKLHLSSLRVTPVGERYRFEHCPPPPASTCESIGRPEGYTRAELNDWNKYRASTVADNVPLIAGVAGVGLAISAVLFLPVTAFVLAVASLASVAYGFLQHPQTKAGLSNEIAGQIELRPELLPNLRQYLHELDSQSISADVAPRVISQGKTVKSTETAPSAAPIASEKVPSPDSQAVD